MATLLEEVQKLKNELFKIKRRKSMKKLSFIIIHIFFLWCFILIYTLKGFNSEEVIIEKPKEIFQFKLESKNELLKEEKFDEMYEEYKEELKVKAFELCNSYINKQKGDCYYIAMKFIKEFKGLTKTKKIKIKESEALSGDLIYYSNNGYGQTHWAVYLDTDISLHGSGNWNGDTIFKKVHLEKMAKPIFYRVVEEE